MHRLIYLLFNYFLFAGTLFAAGDVGLGGGGGDGQGTGGDGTSTDNASGGEAGDSVDTGADDSPADRGDIVPADTEDDQGDVEDAQAAGGDKGQASPKWKAVFEAAKAQGLDKEVKQLYYGQQKILEKFGPGGINEAVKLADAVEQYGGVDGIEQQKAELEAFSADAETFVSDPAKWLQANFAANPDASLKAFMHSLDYVAEHHQEQYDHLMGKVIANDLDQSPIHDIYGLLAGLKENPQAQELAKKLANYYNYRKQLAAKVPEKKVDEQQAKLAEREKEITGKEESLRDQTINSQAIPILGRNMTTWIEKEAKAAGFDLKAFQTGQPGAYQAMRAKIFNTIRAKAAADKTFVRNYKAVLNSGDTKRAIGMMNKKHDELGADITRTVAAEWGIKKKSGVKSGQQGTRTQNVAGNKGSVLHVAAKPDGELINWQDPVTDMFSKIAKMKDGRVVTWV